MKHNPKMVPEQQTVKKCDSLRRVEVVDDTHQKFTDGNATPRGPLRPQHLAVDREARLERLERYVKTKKRSFVVTHVLYVLNVLRHIAWRKIGLKCLNQNAELNKELNYHECNSNPCRLLEDVENKSRQAADRRVARQAEVIQRNQEGSGGCQEDRKRQEQKSTTSSWGSCPGLPRPVVTS